MISPSELTRFFELRQNVFNQIEAALQEDSHCKSYEGAMRLGFPNYFERDNEDSCMRCAVLLDCYVLGPARYYEWYGRTFTEALDKAEKEIESWKCYDQTTDNGVTWRPCHK